MKHAILGAGGVGGFIGAVLGQAGHDVTVVLRPESLAAHPDTLTLYRPTGPAGSRCTRATALTTPVDVFWVTVKATQLEVALREVPDPSLVGTVVPLLNGVDHVARLRGHFGAARVVPATIFGELERTRPGHVVQRTPMVRLAFAAASPDALGAAQRDLAAAGCECAVVADEATLMWRKLAALAAMALSTTASARTVGEVLADPEWSARLEGVLHEASAVGAAEGASLDAAVTLRGIRGLPHGTKSSMQKDVAAGRPPELDAIAGPILRGGAAHGIATPATQALADTIQARVSARR